jgi:ATP-dependent RNA helicase DDX35
VRPGHTFRLCTEEAFDALLPDASVPEMQRSELASLILQLKVRVGCVGVLFDWLSPSN